MNLQKFLDYKDHCPLCGTKLEFLFHSKKKQSCIYEGNFIKIIFDLKSIKKGQKNYKVEFAINRLDNSFFIDFYTKDGVMIDGQTPLFLIKRFREFSDNQGNFKFYKHCENCSRYNYQSQYFSLDYDKQLFENIVIEIEKISFFQKHMDQVKIIEMSNFYRHNETYLTVGRSESLEHYEKEKILQFGPTIKVPLIQFTDKDETVNRINTLLLFS